MPCKRTQLWIEHAEGDLAMAKLAASAGYLCAPAAFHAHQVAEKSLKAILIELGARPPRAHDVQELLRGVRLRGVALRGIDADCARLNPYGVAARYPGDSAMLSSAEVAHLLVAAEAVLNVARVSLDRARALVQPSAHVRERAQSAYRGAPSSVGLARPVEELVRVVVAALNPRRVVLFGSRAMGTARRDSDVDLMVEMPREVDGIATSREVHAAVGTTGVGLDAIVFTPAQVADDADDPTSFLSEILETGLVMYEDAR